MLVCVSMLRHICVIKCRLAIGLICPMFRVRLFKPIHVNKIARVARQNLIRRAGILSRGHLLSKADKNLNIGDGYTVRQYLDCNSHEMDVFKFIHSQQAVLNLNLTAQLHHTVGWNLIKITCWAGIALHGNK